MPRGPRKTRSGAPAQPSTPVADQTYGAGVEQQALARTMPTPNNAAVTPAAPPATAGTASAPAPVDQAAALQAALQAAQGLRGQAGVLSMPTQNPGEPVTAGLSIGPGPGPEALMRPMANATGETLRRLSIDTGDPYWAELAARVRI